MTQSPEDAFSFVHTASAVLEKEVSVSVDNRHAPKVLTGFA